MNTQTNLDFVPRRTSSGFIVLAVGLALAVLSATLLLPYSLASDSLDILSSGQVNTFWLSILGCLSPIALLLDIIGLFMIAGESKKFGKLHERMAWIGVVIFFVANAASLVVNIPLAFAISSQGSLGTALLSAWLGAAFTLFSTLGLILALYPYAGSRLGNVIFAIGALEMVTHLAVTAVSTSGARITELTILNQTSYTLQPFTGGAFPVLTIAGLVWNWLLVGIAVFLAVRYARLSREVRVESVV